MNQKFFCTLASVPLVAVLAACMTLPTQTKTSLWEVSSAQRTVYIASDTQVLSAADYPLPESFAQAFAASGELYVEQVPSAGKKNQSEIHALILEKGVLPENRTLKDVLTAEQLALVKAAAKERGTPFSRIERLRPWLVALSFTQDQSSHSRRPIDRQQQLTPYFYKKAQARQIPATPFESYARIFDITSSLPMDVQVKWLMRASKPDEDDQDQESRIRELVKAWRAGDTAGVIALSGSFFKDIPKVRQALVVDRNEAWVHVLEDKLHTRGKPVFVVVGDGHLMRQDSMLSLLRGDGYQVRQL